TIVNDTDGTFRVHRKGCGDITRRERSRGANSVWDVVAKSARNAVEVERLGFREEFGDEADDFEFVVLPCTKEAQ
ncbi:hypothetical protein HY493_00540, partial [Candidatus Woesearchaeota archaeon]|nr:hypothetical protein [Candidatus Woesearchaeota archaeon]